MESKPYHLVQGRYESYVDSESRSLNIEGYRAYSIGNYSEAEELLEEAVLLDNTNDLAHFNLACVKSLLTGQDGEDRSEEILMHLKEAWEIDEYWLCKTFLDSDLNAVRELAKDEEFIEYNTDDSIGTKIYNFDSNGTFSICRIFKNPCSFLTSKSKEFKYGYYTRICDKILIYIPHPMSDEEALESYMKWPTHTTGEWTVLDL